VQLSPEAEHYAEIWSATPTPVYNEFRVDWKKLAADNPAEIKRISDMWKGQMDKLKEKYPGFNINSVAKWPAGNNMVSPHAFWGPTLMEFQRLERVAASGHESAGHMLESAKREMAAHEEMKKSRERAETYRKQEQARKDAEQYSKVKTGDLLGMNEKREEDLLRFPSREEELKDLFKGGRGKKSRKSKKAKKSRKTRRRA
jgi:hypothetical protein